MLVSTNFGVMITPGQRKVFMDEIDKSAPQYKQLFRETDITDPVYRGAHIGGFGMWPASTEGTAIGQEDVKQGANAELTVERYSKGYSVSWELMQDDQQGVFNGTNGKGGSAKMLARSLQATIESKCAAVLSNGFGDTGYDTTSLFADNHKLNKNATTPPTQSNKLAGTALDVAGLQAACKLMRAQKDNGGVAPVGAIPAQLIIHPDDEFTARTLLNAGLNIVNGVPQAESTLPNLQIVILDYLKDSSAYFLRAKNMDNLVLAWRERPTFNSNQIPQTMDWFFYGYARFIAGYEEWRGLVGVQK